MWKLVLRVLFLYLPLQLIFLVLPTFATAQQQEQQQYTFVTQWGSEGSDPGQFMGQNDVVPSPNGKHIFVPDYENHRIQKFDSNGTYSMEWGSGSESLFRW
jgi:hypothetical protein